MYLDFYADWIAPPALKNQMKFLRQESPNSLIRRDTVHKRSPSAVSAADTSSLVLTMGVRSMIVASMQQIN